LSQTLGGNPVVAGPNIDSATGAIFFDLNKPIIADATVSSWSIYAGATGGQVQLLIFRDLGTTWSFVGASELQTVNALGVNTFALASSISVQANDIIAFYYPPGTSPSVLGDFGNGQTINNHDWPSEPIDPSRLSGTYFGTIPDLQQGASFDETLWDTNSRTYSIAVHGDPLPITGDNGPNALNGTTLDDTIVGLEGNDVLNGKSGADTMRGGLGNDRYYVDHAGDTATEANGEGTDHVVSSVTYSLAGQYIEWLTLTGTANVNGTGNSLANKITGNAGNNIIDGAGGADTMEGRDGNDRYYVQNPNDTVIEAANEGTDHVVSSTSYSLSGQHVEWLTLTGTANINATGNSLANKLTGNDGNNILRGYTGLDSLFGKGGNDTFVFNSASETGKGAARDVIRDFEDFGDDDTIDLSGFAGTLVFSSASSLSGALNEVIAKQSGSDVLIQINTVAGGSAEAEILLANTLRSQITGSDFDLV
jgi:Ca2+-binding RTX toxin-like protein